MVIFQPVFRGVKDKFSLRCEHKPPFPPFQFDETTVKKVCKNKNSPLFFTGRTSEATKICVLPGKHRLFRTGLLVLRVSSWWKWTATAVFQVPKKCCLCWFIPKVNSKTSRLLCGLGKSPVETWNSETTVKTFPRKFDEWLPKNGPKIVVWVSCFLKTAYFRVSNGIYENDFRW